jgi:acetyl-CoA decarbonylase/synthase complex subunit gamma
MALTGIEIFKITPKTNCKECGNPTCMAFAMKVAQGAIPLEKCPYISDEVKAQLAEATAPPMKTIKVGAGENEHTLGGETVLARHEKTFVSKNLYAVSVCNANEDAENENAFASVEAIDYQRIGERMYVEFIYVNYVEGKDKDKFLALVKKAAGMNRAMIIGCADVAIAKEALEIAKDLKPILNGATAANCEAMNELAKEYGVTLGVCGTDINDLYDPTAKLEAAGNKNLVLNATINSIKDAFAETVQVRRAAIKNNDRTFGYPMIVNVGRLAVGDDVMQQLLLLCSP